MSALRQDVQWSDEYSLLPTASSGGASGAGRLLAISLVYILDIFVPPHFKDAAWEFGAATILLERIPLPLVGLAMVFWGGTDFRHKKELPILNLLSWSTLIAGLLCLLLTPMGLSAGSRLSTANLSELTSQYGQQMSQLDQAQERLNNITSEQLTRLTEAFKSQDPTTEALTPQALKDQLIGEIEQARSNAEVIRDRNQKSQTMSLIKSTTKLLVLSVISAYLFIYTWRLTSWA